MTAPTDFARLGLPPSLLEAVHGLGFEAMTEVQSRTLPALLEGRDLLVQAEPGSGKTLAFGLALLARTLPHLPPAPPRPRALVVCPTRELAEQIAGELRRLARRTPNVKVLVLCGGVPFRPQRESLRQGAHVVVGTPGRIEEHLRKSSLALDALEVLVLDEADRLASMGFAPQLEAIIAQAPQARQTLLFSATYPEVVAELHALYRVEPERIDVLPGASGPGRSAEQEAGGPLPATGGSQVSLRFFRVPATERVAALEAWLGAERPASALVFSATRAECASVAEELRRHGWVAASLHGEMSQRERTHAMRLFANGSCPVLIATDVAARGWDIEGLAAVVQLGVPRDASVHTHRVGRTGRSGAGGLAACFIADEDLGALGAIERASGRAVELEPLELPREAAAPVAPERVTLLLAAGKHKKLRPGDVLGALTGEGGVSGADVGRIDIDESTCYVAVRAAVAERALARLASAPVKGRKIRASLAGLSLAG